MFELRSVSSTLASCPWGIRIDTRSGTSGNIEGDEYGGGHEANWACAVTNLAERPALSERLRDLAPGYAFVVEPDDKREHAQRQAELDKEWDEADISDADLRRALK